MATRLDEPISRGRLRQQVTSRILAGVFEGRFPSGTHLVAQHLCELFQVSPTPVRESLVELESLGIVDLLPNRGAIVRPMGAREVREIGQMRRVLEVEATRAACGMIALDELESLEREFERVRSLPHTEERLRAGRAADTWLHGLIAASCGSARLTSEIGRYLTLFRALRNVSQERESPNYFAPSDVIPDQHLAITRALRAGDADGAAGAMERHLRTVTEVLTEFLFGGADAACPLSESEENALENHLSTQAALPSQLPRP